MVSYRAAFLPLPDPHELRSCGEADGQLLHAALCAEPDTAPREIAFYYQNNLADRLRPGRVWSTGCYVGTFGKYSRPTLFFRLLWLRQMKRSEMLV